MPPDSIIPIYAEHGFSAVKAERFKPLSEQSRTPRRKKRLKPVERLSSSD
jgi:hypothetical protein